MTANLILGFDLSFDALYSWEGLAALDDKFIGYLKSRDAALAERLVTGRANPIELAGKPESELMIAAAPALQDFLAELFGIVPEVNALYKGDRKLAPLYSVKRQFVQRVAVRKYPADQAAAFDGDALRADLERRMGDAFTELLFAESVDAWLAAGKDNAEALDVAAKYAAWATLTEAGIERHASGVIFKVPHKATPERLVPVEPDVIASGLATLTYPESKWRAREGFGLTDAGFDTVGALDNANYCIWCHKQGKDSCSKGFKDPHEDVPTFKKNAFGIVQAGCPLEEKISEMNLVETEGYTLSALAIAVIDNPMCAATGHRICNDCMKACIYQKQEPVDIPQIETRVLKNVLALPWGFEIYSLLTRWNPLNLRRPLPLPPSGKKVLVVGLGPAGFTLSHHLMNDGHAVAAIDGLKIEPLQADVSGIDACGVRWPFRPIRDIDELREDLGNRVMAGFGGVAEYGITVRWDKNFLKVIRLLLERRSEFKLYGGVRFGGALNVDSAFAMGFDHIALCAGAGKPTIVPMKNGLAPGVRQASDFLMALQLTGAARPDSIANLQVRLPVVVIGGGLTAIDTATEALAYYPVQVEKFLTRYETLVAELGEEAVRRSWTDKDREVADEFIAHARAIRAEKEAATKEGRTPRMIALLREWGGSTIVYRRRLIDSPSYTLNHEEVAKAMEEGIRFAEQITPEEVLLDDFGQSRALRVSSGSKDNRHEYEIPARMVLVAAGTQPNTVLGRENPGAIELDGKYFQALDEQGGHASPEKITKPSAANVLMSLQPDGRAISFFGDLHPSYAGNVVKAMASAKQGYPIISRKLASTPASNVSPDALFARLDDEMRPRVAEVVRLTPNIAEVIVRAPLAARAFKPGQFYRLQNYETSAHRTEDTCLAMEGLALTGASVDVDKGLLSTIVLEMGGSSDLCEHLKPGEPVVLMGPTGRPTEVRSGETVALIGGGLGNAVLFSIGQAFRSLGSKVIYFAGYKRVVDRYKVEDIEHAADAIVWCCDEAPGFTPARPHDGAIVGNIIEAIDAYGSGRLGAPPIPLSAVDRIIAIGSDGMMAAVAKARHGILAKHLKAGHRAIGSINSPMQCMMKEICAQCLQVHHDPQTGLESVAFSCFDQDQDLDRVDFRNLRGRLGQNSLQEKLTKLWIDRSLRKLGLRQPAAAAE